MTRHVAHINWSTMRGDSDDRVMRDFVRAIDRIDALAERSPGFVWRHGSEASEARTIGWPMFRDDPRVIATCSVWETPGDLARYVYRTAHDAFRRRMDEWFVADAAAGHVLWWVDPGHIPTMSEARLMVERFAATGADDTVFRLNGGGQG